MQYLRKLRERSTRRPSMRVRTYRERDNARRLVPDCAGLWRSTSGDRWRRGRRMRWRGQKVFAGLCDSRALSAQPGNAQTCRNGNSFVRSDAGGPDHSPVCAARIGFQTRARQLHLHAGSAGGGRFAEPGRISSQQRHRVHSRRANDMKQVTYAPAPSLVDFDSRRKI